MKYYKGRGAFTHIHRMVSQELTYTAVELKLEATQQLQYLVQILQELIEQSTSC